MPPKTVRIDPDTVYRSETSLQQKKFPSRRRSVRPRSSAPRPLRQQSTLTQLTDWSLVPSSEPEDDEDDLEPVKPRRKKRKSEDGKKQTTLTQMHSSSFGQDQYDGACDEFMENFQDDENVVRDSQSTPRRRQDQHEEKEHGIEEAGRNMARMDAVDDEGYEEREDSQEEEAERVDSARGKPQRQQRPSQELPLSTSLLRTPKRRFLSEVPSSNTPQSAILSIHSMKSMRSPERSPLKAKSANVWMQQHSPSKSQLSAVPDSPVKPVSPFRLAPNKSRQPVFRVPEKPPSLIHRSTIPDSEDTATQITPLKKKPKFRSQIPDTQFDAFGEEVAPVTETQLQIFSYDGVEYYPDDYGSFDPVCSALDRDAARYMQTQLLQDKQRQEMLHKEVSFTQEEQEHLATAAQQSQELGEEPGRPSIHCTEPEVEHEDAPTQSPAPTPQRTQPHLYSDEIEMLDLTEVEPNATAYEVIRIASSPSSKSVSSGKYPSSPPVTDTNDPPAEVVTGNNNDDASGSNNRVFHSPLLPALEVPIDLPRPSQVSTIGGTQLFHLATKPDPKAAVISSSPPVFPPSTSSPPPEVKHHLSKLMGIPDSEDEDEDYDNVEVGYEDHDLDLSAAGGQEETEQREEHVHNRSRLRDILPDTLLDFSLPPPPPTQSSVRSLGVWNK